MEVVFSATAISGENSLPRLNQNTTNDETINQEELKRIKKDIEMLNEIKENKDSINFCMKEEETTERDLSMLDVAMDLSHISDKKDYTNFIQERLPRLHDQIIPSSLR